MIFSFESILLITACLVVLVGVQVRWQAIARQRAHAMGSQVPIWIDSRHLIRQHPP